MHLRRNDTGPGSPEESQQLHTNTSRGGNTGGPPRPAPPRPRLPHPRPFCAGVWQASRGSRGGAWPAAGRGGRGLVDWWGGVGAVGRRGLARCWGPILEPGCPERPSRPRGPWRSAASPPAPRRTKTRSGSRCCLGSPGPSRGGARPAALWGCRRTRARPSAASPPPTSRRWPPGTRRPPRTYPSSWTGPASPAQVRPMCARSPPLSASVYSHLSLCGRQTGTSKVSLFRIPERVSPSGNQTLRETLPKTVT